MEIDFESFFNKHTNSKALVLGHGPSLNPHISKIEEYRNNGYVIIGCNDWFWFYDNAPDYWINANPQDTPKTYQKYINSNDTIFVYADSVDSTDPEWVRNNINKYSTYDQRHFNNQKCDRCNDKCVIKNRKTIQEYLRDYTGYDKLYSTGDSVAVHMLAFSILIGCKEICYTGIDLDYKLGYATNKENHKPINPVGFDGIRNNILNDIDIIISSANKINAIVKKI